MRQAYPSGQVVLPEGQSLSESQIFVHRGRALLLWPP